MILEGVVTTQNSDLTTNIAAMGPEVGSDLSSFILKPFKTSRTFENLSRTSRGILHVVDNVEIILSSVINIWHEQPQLKRSPISDCHYLADACRWFEFEVIDWEVNQDRTRLTCRTLHAETIRDFFGFNRAKHVILEAAVLASRIHMTGPEPLLKRITEWKEIVRKTGGESDLRAWAMVESFLAKSQQTDSGSSSAAHEASS